MLAVLSSDGKNQRSPGPGSEERQRSSRQPRTPLRGTHPGRLCQNAGADGAADCLPFRAAAADLAVFRGRSDWTGKARRLPPAVGAGFCGLPSQTTWHKEGGPKERGRLFTFFTPGPSGPEGEWAATQGLPAGRNFFAEGAAKNGVLVPLPP